MKNTRKLIPALAMLLVSAVLMSTSSFAWFSMNKEVKVTGMQVNAISDSAYLLVSTKADATIDTIRTDAAKEAAATTAVADLKPIAPKATTDAAAGLASNWYYEEALAPDASTGDGTKRDIDTLDGYVYVQKVYVGLAEGSREVTNLVITDLAITNATGGKVNEAVTVLVTSNAGTGIEHVNKKGDKSVAGNVLAASISGDTVVELSVYIYIDGANETVYTENADNLAGATVSMTLNVA